MKDFILINISGQFTPWSTPKPMSSPFDISPVAHIQTINEAYMKFTYRENAPKWMGLDGFSKVDLAF